MIIVFDGNSVRVVPIAGLRSLSPDTTIAVSNSFIWASSASSVTAILMSVIFSL